MNLPDRAIIEARIQQLEMWADFARAGDDIARSERMKLSRDVLSWTIGGEWPDAASPVAYFAEGPISRLLSKFIRT